MQCIELIGLRLEYFQIHSLGFGQSAILVVGDRLIERAKWIGIFRRRPSALPLSASPRPG
jgi:hypothetical protein